MRALAYLPWLLAVACTSPPPATFTTRTTPLVLPEYPEDRATATRAQDSNASDEPLDREPDQIEAEALEKLMRRAETIRGLKFRSTLEVRIQDRRAMRAFMAAQLDDEELKLEKRRAVLLGMLEPTVDIRKETEDLAERDLLGYYDPKQKRLVLRDDVALSIRYNVGRTDNLMWRATIVHELVHALQDQHFGLSLKKDRSDEENAYGALVEGDATLAMIDYMIRKQGVTFESIISDPKTFDSMFLSGLQQGFSPAAPSLLQSAIGFRYAAGAAFCAALAREDGFQSVDKAYKNPPTASSQILDPEYYLRHVKPTRLRFAQMGSDVLSRAGYQVWHRDTLGQLGVTGYLATSGMNSDSLGAQWAGDELVLLHKGNRDAYVWAMSFVDVAGASNVKDRIKDVAAAQGAKHHDIRAYQHGEVVLVVADITESLHPAIEESFHAHLKRRDGEH